MDIHKFIKEVPMFQHCTAKELKLLANLDHCIVMLKKGDYIIRQGHKSDSPLPIYVVVYGSVLIKKRGVLKPLATLKAGATFGEMSFLSKSPRTTNVIANEEAAVIEMNNHFFEHIPHTLQIKVKDYLIEILIERLNNMNNSFGKISNVAKDFCTQLEKHGFI